MNETNLITTYAHVISLNKVLDMLNIKGKKRIKALELYSKTFAETLKEDPEELSKKAFKYMYNIEEFYIK